MFPGTFLGSCWKGGAQRSQRGSALSEGEEGGSFGHTTKGSSLSLAFHGWKEYCLLPSSSSLPSPADTSLGRRPRGRHSFECSGLLLENAREKGCQDGALNVGFSPWKLAKM